MALNVIWQEILPILFISILCRLRGILVAPVMHQKVFRRHLKILHRRVLRFRPMARKHTIAGNVNDTIFQYTLSTPWDISTATYALKSLYSGDLDTESRSVAFSSDGIRCYILGDSTDTIYQYILAVTYTLTGTIEDPTGTAIANAEVRIIGLSGTAWDLSTAVYASKSLSVSAQDTSPLGVAFSTDGTKAYVVGNANDTIYQYTLSTAWDVSTGTYASKSMSVASQDTTPIGMTFSADGTKAYVIGDTNDTIYQYTLSTAWDISTSSYASKSLSVGAQDRSCLWCRIIR